MQYIDPYILQVEISVVVLWEGVKYDPAQVKVRTEVISSVAEIIDYGSLQEAVPSYNSETRR